MNTPPCHTPCPFCASTYLTSDGETISCSRCHATGPSQAPYSWSTRATTAPTPRHFPIDYIRIQSTPKTAWANTIDDFTVHATGTLTATAVHHATLRLFIDELSFTLRVVHGTFNSALYTP